MRILGKLSAVVGVLLLLPSMAFAQASITGLVQRHVGRRASGRDGRSGQPGAHRKGPHRGHRRQRPLPDRRSAARRLHRHVHAARLQHRQARRRRRSPARAPSPWTPTCASASLEETITVTGEAPVVDTQSLTKQQVLNSDMVDALPSARNYFGLARMISGHASGGGNDVGGSLIQDVGQSLTVHGSRTIDQRVTVNGVNTMTLQAGGNIGGQTPDVGSAAEVTVDTTSLVGRSADRRRAHQLRPEGRRQPASPTRRSSRSRTRACRATTSPTSCRAAGLARRTRSSSTSTSTSRSAVRSSGTRCGSGSRRATTRSRTKRRHLRQRQRLQAERVALRARPTKPAVNKGEQFNNSLRVTWQATPKIKIAGTYKADKWCNCPNHISATRAPEAGRDRRFPRLRQEHAEWTSPITNRLLFEAVGLHLFERWGDMHLRVNGGSLDDPAKEAILPQLISVTEQSNDLVYRGRDDQQQHAGAELDVPRGDVLRHRLARVQGRLQPHARLPRRVPVRAEPGELPLQQRRARTRSRERARRTRSMTNLDNDLGLFAQDRWTMNRLTLNLALRFDYFQTSFPEQTLGPAPLTPNRNITFPAADNLTGRTSPIAPASPTTCSATARRRSRWLQQVPARPDAERPRPQSEPGAGADADGEPVVERPRRTGINRDFIPQCDLLNPLPNGECGQISTTSTFGTDAAGRSVRPGPDSRGCNHRQANWEFSASVQHELMPRVALDVGYFRRIWKNFHVTDNLLVGAGGLHAVQPDGADRPASARRSGQTLTGLYNVVPDEVRPGAEPQHAVRQVRQADRALERLRHQRQRAPPERADAPGRRQQRQADRGQLRDRRQAAGDAQPQRGRCRSREHAPDAPAQWRPAEFCHREQPMLTGVKALAIYIVPKIDVQVSGFVPQHAGNDALARASRPPTPILAANSTLGRPLSGNAREHRHRHRGAERARIPSAATSSTCGSARCCGSGDTRTVVSLDIYNALNSDAMITQNQAYASYLRPTEILNARLMKFSWAFDF